MNALCTTVGAPFSSRQDTSASPTPSSMIASSVLNALLALNAPAAAFTAFCSAGVYARRACCILLLSWASTLSGMSEGLWLTK